MTAVSALRGLNFGSVDSESESDLMIRFVTTREFQEFLSESSLVALGPKGSGKSAIFRMLAVPEYFGVFQEFFAEQLGHVIPEAATGSGDHHDVTGTDFGRVAGLPGYTHEDFWRVYIVIKAAEALGKTELKLRGEIGRLAKLLGKKKDWRVIPVIKKVWDALLGDAPTTVHFKIAGNEIDFDGKKIVDIEEALVDLHAVLEENGRHLWLLFDKIDEICPTDPAMRRAAIEALFQIQVGFLGRYPRLKLKVLLRTDIWEELKFINKTHIDDKIVRLQWHREGLLDLVLKRALANPGLRRYVADRCPVQLKQRVEEHSIREKEAIFYTVFDNKVYSGKREAELFDWLFERICDAQGDHFPRELIVWANAATKAQLANDSQEPKEPAIISGAAALEGFKETSRFRVRTYLAEFPEVEQELECFQGLTKPQFSRDELHDLFAGCAMDPDASIARLHHLGVLRPQENKHVRVATDFEVARLYRIGLGLNLKGRP